MLFSKIFSCDFAILTRSTIKTTDTIVWEDGVTYPLVKLEISSGSHPFFTGKQKLLDTTVELRNSRKNTQKQKQNNSFAIPFFSAEAQMVFELYIICIAFFLSKTILKRKTVLGYLSEIN